MSSSANLMDRLRGQLVVSCQAAAGAPLEATAHIVALAQSAILGGAKGLRIEGVENVRTVRAVTETPIIGIVKAQPEGFEPYITTRPEEVQALSDAGADIIAFDATDRSRPFSLSELVARIRACGRISMADISVAAEAEIAIKAGANFVGTTLAGYTSYSRQIDGPDLELMKSLAKARISFVSEGRIWSPEEAAQCMGLGAEFVVVGSAITRPDEITRRYAQALMPAGQKRFGEVG